MSQTESFEERDLAALAKKCREAAGKTRADAAEELGVSRPTIINAEEQPERSLTKVRIRIIEAYSGYRVSGPIFILERK